MWWSQIYNFMTKCNTFIFVQNHLWWCMSSYTMINHKNSTWRTINSNSDDHVGDGRRAAAGDGARVVRQQTLRRSRREWKRQIKTPYSSICILPHDTNCATVEKYILRHSVLNSASSSSSSTNHFNGHSSCLPTLCISPIKEVKKIWWLEGWYFLQTECFSDIHVWLPVTERWKEIPKMKWHYFLKYQHANQTSIKGELNLDNKWQSDDLFYIIMNEIHPRFNQFCVILKLS